MKIRALPETPGELAGPLTALAQEIRLDFYAADLKRDSHGAWRFLEINNQPMFAAFDDASDGEICREILGALT